MTHDHCLADCRFVHRVLWPGDRFGAWEALSQEERTTEWWLLLTLTYEVDHLKK
jgi:hypothetical protein